MICVQVEPVFRNRKAITDGVEEVISLKNFTLVSFTVLVLLASSLAHSKTVIKVQIERNTLSIYTKNFKEKDS